MVFLFNFMRFIATEVDQTIRSSPPTYRSDLAVIAVAAVFEEHCRRLSRPMQYENCKKVNEGNRKFFFEEMKQTIFHPTNLHRWLKMITARYQNVAPVELNVYGSPQRCPNMYSPIHLIVDSLTSVYV